MNYWIKPIRFSHLLGGILFFNRFDGSSGTEANFQWHLGTAGNAGMVPHERFQVHRLSHHLGGPLVSSSQSELHSICSHSPSIIGFPLWGRSVWAGKWLCKLLFWWARLILTQDKFIHSTHPLAVITHKSQECISSLLPNGNSEWLSAVHRDEAWSGAWYCRSSAPCLSLLLPLQYLLKHLCCLSSFCSLNPQTLK